MNDEIQLNTQQLADLQNVRSLLIRQKRSMKMAVTEINDFHGTHRCLSPVPLIWNRPRSLDYRQSISQDMAYPYGAKLLFRHGYDCLCQGAPTSGSMYLPC